MLRALLILVCLSAFGLVTASPRFEIKGMAVGSTEEQFHSCNNFEGDRYCTAKKQTLADRPAEIIATMFKGGACYIRAKFDQSDYGAVRDAFIGKYGQPDRRDSSPVQNRMGASFENEVVAWAKDGQELTIYRRQGSIDKGAATIADEGCLKEWKEAKTANASKDL